LNFELINHTFLAVSKSVIDTIEFTETLVPNTETFARFLTAGKNEPMVIPKNDLQCMSENIYYEAATQSYVGKIAVGQVVLNRTKDPRYPASVCGVIYEGSQNIHTSTCQFSWTCSQDKRAIDKSSQYWADSVSAAKELMLKKDTVLDITQGATHYHADYTSPLWAKKLQYVTQIERHRFYR